MSDECRAPSEGEATKASHTMSDPDSSRLAKSLGGSVLSLAKNRRRKLKRGNSAKYRSRSQSKR